MHNHGRDTVKDTKINTTLDYCLQIIHSLLRTDKPTGTMIQFIQNSFSDSSEPLFARQISQCQEYQDITRSSSPVEVTNLETNKCHRIKQPHEYKLVINSVGLQRMYVQHS